mmetsp:Transcript_41823/g.69853  ORF Transcript_41823/g.69853 Transcript_41823/m.69853 type:complete len:855 (-) Transcript_41823:334-2898(-)
MSTMRMKHVTTVTYLRALIVMGLVMAAVITINFIKLPAMKNDPIEQDVQDLRAALTARELQLTRLEKTIEKLTAQESKMEGIVSQMQGGSGLATTPTFHHAPDVFTDLKPKVASVSPPGEFIPDLSKYVKKMSLLDEKGCSSGQHWKVELQACEFGPILRFPTLTPQELEYFFNIGRPVILTNFTPEWKAYENWVPERLKEKYGRFTVNVQKGRSSNTNFETQQHLLRRDLNFADFIDSVMKNEKKNDLYLTANNNLLHKPEMRGILGDMDPFYSGFLTVDPTQTHFWFGGSGTKTPLHFDPISLFHTHIKGRKLWTLWPPEMAPYLYHREKVYSEVDSYNPDHEKYPLYKYAFRTKEMIGPGETLFIPTGWWHTVDSLETPTVTLSATSWVSRFFKFESKLRQKWPQKGAHPPNSPKGPALPGEATPKTFDIHSWCAHLAASHQKLPALPATALDWTQALKAEDADDLRPILEGYASDDISRSEAFLFMVLNPICSKLPIDWQAWIVENLGLGNSAVSLVTVIGRDGDSSTLTMVQTALTKCLKMGPSLWDTTLVEASADEHRSLMEHIHGNQVKLGAGKQDRQKQQKNWQRIRKVNGWEPPDEYTIQHSEHFPGAEILSDTPRTSVIRGFLSAAECDDLTASALPNLVRSAVIGAENDQGKVSNDRTSMGAWMPSTQKSAGILEQKAAKWLGLGVEREEGVHVLRYHEGETYNRHLDGCDTGSPEGHINPECERFLQRSGDRIASVIVMLDPPEQGGATAFPRVKVDANGKSVFGMNYVGTCDKPDTLQVKLNKGDAILFWGYHPSEDHPDGQIDWASEHTGCKVEKGTKWIATVWFRGSKWRNKPNYSVAV